MRGANLNIFDKKSSDYDAWYDKNKFIFLSEAVAIKKAIPAKGRGVEIGAGTGRFTKALGIREGVDISSNMLKIAAKRGIKTKKASAYSLPYKTGSFDYALLIVTLCFLKHPLKALTEARRVLKPKGIVIIGIIDRNSRIGRKCKNKKSIYYKEAVFY
ncbi:MAG TPA: class I SAM-dependent methyltransferase, partial [Firmicutes bacterium]|nr:class I SAM-dependent methyltransferase [Bacillota bacterium]